MWAPPTPNVVAENAISRNELARFTHARYAGSRCAVYMRRIAAKATIVKKRPHSRPVPAFHILIYKNYSEMRFRPFCLLRCSTALPPRALILLLNPCTLLRCLFFG